MDLIQKYNQHNQFGIHNNLKLSIIEDGHIEYLMQLELKHFASETLVHGGTLAGLMDAILSVAAFSAIHKENKKVATVDFNINYLRPLTRKMEIRGVGKVVKKGKRIIVVKGEIYNDENQLVAIGNGNIIPIAI